MVPRRVGGPYVSGFWLLVSDLRKPIVIPLGLRYNSRQFSSPWLNGFVVNGRRVLGRTHVWHCAAPAAPVYGGVAQSVRALDS